jgi:hypothetical protein
LVRPDGFECRSAAAAARQDRAAQVVPVLGMPSPGISQGGLFAASKLPLTKWSLAIYLMTESENDIAALGLIASPVHVRHGLAAEAEADRRDAGTQQPAQAVGPGGDG